MSVHEGVLSASDALDHLLSHGPTPPGTPLHDIGSGQIQGDDDNENDSHVVEYSNLLTQSIASVSVERLEPVDSRPKARAKPKGRPRGSTKRVAELRSPIGGPIEYVSAAGAGGVSDADMELVPSAEAASLAVVAMRMPKREAVCEPQAIVPCRQKIADELRNSDNRLSLFESTEMQDSLLAWKRKQEDALLLQQSSPSEEVQVLQQDHYTPVARSGFLCVC